MKTDDFFGCCQVAGDLYGTVLQANVRTYVANPQAQFVMPGHDLFFAILNRVKEDFRKEVTVEDKASDGQDD